jgi:hypothetical protein
MHGPRCAALWPAMFVMISAVVRTVHVPGRANDTTPVPTLSR